MNDFNPNPAKVSPIAPIEEVNVSLERKPEALLEFLKDNLYYSLGEDLNEAIKKLKKDVSVVNVKYKLRRLPGDRTITNDTVDMLKEAGYLEKGISDGAWTPETGEAFDEMVADLKK